MLLEYYYEFIDMGWHSHDHKYFYDYILFWQQRFLTATSEILMGFATRLKQLSIEAIEKG